jgi:uncharacterized protein YlxP (DUF503 family)
MALHVLALAVDLRLPACGSLKEKRSVVRTIVEGGRRRHGVAAAETGRQDQLQRAELGFAATSGTASQAVEVIDALERFVWSFPEIEVLGAERHWLEVD